MNTLVEWTSRMNVGHAQLLISQMQEQVDEIIKARREKKAEGKRKLKEKKAKKSKRTVDER